MVRASYKIGYGITIVWMLYLLYGGTHYDELHDEAKTSLLLFTALAGLIMLPVYFISTYLCALLRSRARRSR